MPRHRYDKSHKLSMQPRRVEEDLWKGEVLPRLPGDVEEQARHYKAFERTRGLSSATDLLRGLLAYVLCAPSFQRLGAWAVLIGLADMSDSAWSRRLLKASAWLLWLLGELLSVPVMGNWLQERVRGRVLLVDATRLRQPGGCGDDWRVHSGYDLKIGRLSEVSVTDQHTGETLDHFHLQPGDLVVADMGYGYRHQVAVVKRQQADAVLRITPGGFPVEDEQAGKLDVLAWLRSPGPAVRSQQCWCQWDGQPYGVRLIAYQLPPAVAEAARERKMARARAKGKTISAQTLFLAGWVVLISTLPAQWWPAEDVLCLYRARWQVELVYKRMKQLLRLNQLHSTTPQGIQATVRALLVAWALQEEEARQIRNLLQQAQAEVDQQEARPSQPNAAKPLSSWVLTGLCLDTLRQQVQGHWSAKRLRACLPRLHRFLVSHRGRRLHQETALRAWLASSRLQRPAGLEPTG